MIASVTGCSTWRRVLTSRKVIVLAVPGLADHELDRAGAQVSDVAGQREGAVAERGTHLVA